MIKKTPNNLQKLREQKGWSQSAVSKFLGIQVTTVSRHESGDRNLTSDMVAKYAELYSVDRLSIYFDRDENDELTPPKSDA